MIILIEILSLIVVFTFLFNLLEFCGATKISPTATKVRIVLRQNSKKSYFAVQQQSMFLFWFYINNGDDRVREFDYQEVAQLFIDKRVYRKTKTKKLKTINLVTGKETQNGTT